MKIKKIQPEDFERLADFFVRNNVEAVTRHFRPFPLTRETAQRIACQPHQDHFYLGLVEGSVVGFSMLRGWEEGFPIPSFGIFIDHQRHGRGFGQQLLDLTLEAAKQLQCKQVRLTVNENNPAAVHIYQSRGFQTIERIQSDDANGSKIIMIKEMA